MLNGRKIDHLVLRTGQLDRMVSFYTDIFNAELARRDDRIGLVQLRIGDFLLDLLGAYAEGSTLDREQDGVLDHFSIEVDPVSDSELEALSKMIGAMPSMRTLHGAKGFGKSITVSDPDGNRIEIKFYAADQ